MKSRLILTLLSLLIVTLLVIAPWVPMEAQGRSGDQQMARVRFVKDGVQAQGSGILQIGEAGTLSAAVASATRTEVVAAPTAGSIYLKGIWVEKATATTGLVTVSYGTGANCATGPTTILSIGAGSPAIGFYPVNTIVPATKALCLTTDAATTSARALTN